MFSFFRRKKHANQVHDEVEHYEAKIKALRDAVEPVSGSNSMYVTDAYLKRYLECCNWNLRFAGKILEQNIKWSTPYKPGEIRWNEVTRKNIRGILDRAKCRGAAASAMKAAAEAASASLALAAEVWALVASAWAMVASDWAKVVSGWVEVAGARESVAASVSASVAAASAAAAWELARESALSVRAAAEWNSMASLWAKASGA